jgi:hypothetical protein
MYRTYRNVFTTEECDKFTQIVGSREVESGKNVYLEEDSEFAIYEIYGKPLQTLIDCNNTIELSEQGIHWLQEWMKT